MTIEDDIRQVPVLLVTGYLGSGKTTLLNRILSNKKGIKFAVIVNDIGEVNIDADLIEKGGIVGKTDDSLVALQNGCICCTLKMDLVAQISELTSSRKFDYIVIEASGICEPEPIAQTICTIPQMGSQYVRGAVPYVDCIVTVVDALRMRDEFDSGRALEKENIEDDDLEQLVIEQLEFCNVVLLNKASEVSEADLGKLRSIVAAINPGARILQCDYGDIDLDEIIYTGDFDYFTVSGSAAWVAGVEGDVEADDDDDDDDDHDHEEHGHHHHHHEHEGEGEALEYGIDTFVYYRRKPLDLNKFDRMVYKSWPSSVIRAKGLCYFSDNTDKAYLFEQAGRQKTVRDAGLWYATMPPEELADMMARTPQLRKDWDSEFGDRMQKIVFIGQKMDRAAIENLMDSCLAD